MTSAGVLQIMIYFGLCSPHQANGHLHGARFQGERTFAHPLLRWLEVLTYKLIGVREDRGATLDAVCRLTPELRHSQLRLVCSR